MDSRRVEFSRDFIIAKIGLQAGRRMFGLQINMRFRLKAPLYETGASRMEEARCIRKQALETWGYGSRLKIDEGREPARQLGTAGVSNHLEHSQHRMHLSSFISARADHDRHRGSSGWAPLNRTPSSDDHMLGFLPHECPEIEYPSSIFKIITTDYHLGYRSGKSFLSAIDVTHEWILGVSTQGDASNTCEIELPGLAVNRQTQFASVSLPLPRYSGWAWKSYTVLDSDGCWTNWEEAYQTGKQPPKRVGLT